MHRMTKKMRKDNDRIEAWLAGARYRHAIFKNARHGHLSAAPARLVEKSYPELAGMGREELCIWNARNIAAFCEEENDG